MLLPWEGKLAIYFFVIGFLIDFTTLPEFLFWQANGYSVDENRVIGVLIHLPFLVKPLFSLRINALDTNQLNRLLLLASVANCLLNFMSSLVDNAALVLASLILGEFLMMIIFICLEYHMVKDVNCVSVSNVARLSGRAVGQFISLRTRKIDLSHLFFVSSTIQVVFTLCLLFLPVDSPEKESPPLVTEKEEEEEKPRKLSCYAKVCSCFVQEKKPISTLSWFMFIVLSIPVYTDVLTYDLVSEKRYPLYFFGFLSFADGVGAIIVVLYFIRFVTSLDRGKTRDLCVVYIMIKVIAHALVLYGLSTKELEEEQIITLWSLIHFMTSFAEEGLYNLFLMDTTERSDGSVFFLSKCQFVLTLGMIVSFLLTTFNMCTLNLDRKDYTKLIDYVSLTAILNIMATSATFNL